MSHRCLQRHKHLELDFDVESVFVLQFLACVRAWQQHSAGFYPVINRTTLFKMESGGWGGKKINKNKSTSLGGKIIPVEAENHLRLWTNSPSVVWAAEPFSKRTFHAPLYFIYFLFFCNTHISAANKLSDALNHSSNNKTQVFIIYFLFFSPWFISIKIRIKTAEYCPLTVVAPLTLLLSYANQNRAQQESQSESFCFFYTRPFVVQNFSGFF